MSSCFELFGSNLDFVNISWLDVEEEVAAEAGEEDLGLGSNRSISSVESPESTKSTELPRYSDKYRPSTTSQPALKRSDLHAPFFPSEIFEAYFNPKKKSKARKQAGQKRKLNLDEMLDDDETNESAQEGSDAGGSQGEPDYDTEEEYDNDYADNYFDNGEGENFDDLGDGGGGDDGGIGGDYD
ncbi:hypothetical protein LENED_007005 [Lentinula edodes]|uniref:DNA-directed RNA polymerase III subunit n=1 Tax=Lentinula edodes TaxID=5353 RepID=A0A1Q3ED80_LENED|nr:hypothetical protein LENED_007005 [Lentinula edodes]